MMKFVYCVGIGALTSKPYSFVQRPWELKIVETFDPQSAVYTPINVDIFNNKVKRILPVNDYNFGQNYNWISNKTRFFFELISAQEKELSFYSVPLSPFQTTNNFYLLNKISTKISKFSNIYKFWFFIRDLGFDLYALQSFKEFTTYFKKVFTIFYIRNLKVNNLFPVSFEKFSDSFGYTRNSVGGCKKVFLMGFNPYFLDPVLNFDISSKSNNNLVSVYTFFFSGFPGFNFSYNSIPTLKNLQLFFSGKHRWSTILTNSDSIIFIDYSFLFSLPQRLLVLMLKFINNFPNSVYIEGIKKYDFFSLGVSKLNNFNNRFWSSKFFMNLGFEADKTTNFKNFYFKDPVNMNIYSYIFGLNSLRFSYFSNFADSGQIIYPSDEIFNYFFPISSFLEFSGTYNVFNPVTCKNTNVSELTINPSSEKKPISIFFKMFITRVKYSIFNNHFYISKFFINIFFIFFILYGLLVNWFFHQIEIPTNYVKMTFFDFINGASSKIFNYYKYSTFFFRNFSFEYPMQKKNYFNGNLELRLKNFIHNYDQHQFGSFSDSQFCYSKTLSLERAFIIQRFSNFKKKIVLTIYN